MALRHSKISTLLTTPQLKFKWCCCSKALNTRLGQQIRHASLIKRPYRPYTFTQLIVLSDGSTFTMRTTSPAPVYKSTKDSRNHPLWQPSSAALRNVETDEAGRLRAFRKRFGHDWDADEKEPELKKSNNDLKIRSRSGKSKNISDKDSSEDEQSLLQLPKKTVVMDSMMDLISNAATNSSSTSVTGRMNQDTSLDKKPSERSQTVKTSPGKNTKLGA
ncbi:putative 50s ribosomal protein [Erysiphe neolycopersici]|uniref:Putative 50s ribosomal protein n=1 Tax=Erysiphe neolycopersici TaxID=212602 RepID=A0A420HXP2_9PEZI|nr:putative 50s ribosomal protein [Erysiphe neolycopersici]